MSDGIDAKYINEVLPAYGSFCSAVHPHRRTLAQQEIVGRA
jgi:hypothetical protein